MRANKKTRHLNPGLISGEKKKGKKSMVMRELTNLNPDVVAAIEPGAEANSYWRHVVRVRVVGREPLWKLSSQH